MNRSMTLSARTLADEVSWMTKLRPGPGLNPATKTIEVTAALGALQLRRTDFEQYRETVIPAEGAGQFAAVVDASALLEVARQVRNKRVTIDLVDNKLVVSTAKSTASIGCADVEFPTWPNFEVTETGVMLAASQVARALTSVGNDPTLPMLTTVAFDNGTLVTTDRFRLTRITYDKTGFTMLVPGMVLKAFATGTTVVNVEPGRVAGLGSPLVRLSGGGRSIIATPSGEQFPKWRQLIPDNPPVCVMVRREELLAAIVGTEVTLLFREDGTVTATSRDGENLSVDRSIDATLIGGADLPYSVTMLAKYLTDSLRGVSSGMVLIKVTPGPKPKPVVLQDVSGNALHLVMPIRMPA